jgi:hypothetical protein
MPNQAFEVIMVISGIVLIALVSVAIVSLLAKSIRT